MSALINQVGLKRLLWKCNENHNFVEIKTNTISKKAHFYQNYLKTITI